MATWKKYFNVHKSPLNADANRDSGTGGNVRASKFSSYLNEVYTGTPNRVDRYAQYDQMDADTEINAALDTIAEFCTQFDTKTDTPFDVHFNGTPTDTEVTVIKKTLKQWCRINEFDKRLFRMLRSTIKYGDQFFIRDPETFEWSWVDPTQLTKVIINETKGKRPEQYVIKNLGLDIAGKTATDVMKHDTQYMSMNSVPGVSGNPGSMTTSGNRNFGSSTAATNEFGVDAAHMVHFSMTEGMDLNWPFGTSLLEPIFKIFKQKELLEDSIIIYRVQRAPERRIFYIDVGNMPAHMAMSFVERVKNEIHQRRIPSRNGGGATVMDSSYNPLCLALDTKIPLLDGRTVELNQLIDEYQAGKENWVYSCDPVSGAVVPGVISWAGVTRKNAQVIRLTLDNGQSIVVTPDHRIPVLGRGFIEAQHLTPHDSLISFETRYKSLSADADRSYQQVYDHETNKWVFTHRMVAGFFKDRNKHQEFTFSEEYKGACKTTVHHQDYNRYNNDPRNLTWMHPVDHTLYHSYVKKDYWENLSPIESDRIKNKIRSSLAQTRAAMSADDISKISESCSNGQRARWEAVDRNSAAYYNYTSTLSLARKQYISVNPEFKQLLLNNLSVQQAKPWDNVKFVWTQEMLQRVVDTVKSGVTKRIQLINAMNTDSVFLSQMKAANPATIAGVSKITDSFTDSKLKRMYDKFGYDNFKDFVEKTQVYNHKITAIEWLDQAQDTGCITIDAAERWHSHHTFATSSGIFVKNSIMEDYFFAQSADGRGSKVETLPGGENLGQIDDLKFFTNKMMRALRIPSSYMPTGPDDGTATYNDGKVGTAFIQEFRFNKYCQRIQSLVAPIFDEEFKLFMKFKGLEIDASTFDLRFVPPQNFAAYREIELNSSRVSIFGQMAEVPYMSKRFVLKKYLNLDEDEIIENERMWLEENPDALENAGQTQADMLGGMPGGVTDSNLGTNDLGAVGINLPPEGGPDLSEVPAAGGEIPAGGTTPPIGA